MRTLSTRLRFESNVAVNHRHSVALPAAVLGALLCLSPATAGAQQGPGESGGGADLAKQLSNPISSLTSVPFQSNWDFGVGPGDDTRFLLNFQPVMPFSLNKDWNLITRVIVPMIEQPALFPEGEPSFGLSDILVSMFFSPASPGKSGIIWGVGPALQLPTTSDPYRGSQKWAAGPSVVALKQRGHWTYGGLFNQIWSYAGDEDRSSISQAFLQPFVSYTTSAAVTVALNTESVVNWNAEDGEQWTVPINLQVSKVVRLGKKPLSVGAAVGYYADKPEGGPSWKFRTNITLLFPK